MVHFEVKKMNVKFVRFKKSWQMLGKNFYSFGCIKVFPSHALWTLRKHLANFAVKLVNRKEYTEIFAKNAERN